MKSRQWFETVARRKYYERFLSPDEAKRIMEIKPEKQRHRAFLLATQKVCQKCGTNESLTIDHIIPVAITKQKRIKNLRNQQLLCFDCNQKKGATIE